MDCSEIDCFRYIVAGSIVAESILTVFNIKRSIVVESIERVHWCEVHCCVVHSYRATGAESLVAGPIVAGSIE